MTKKRHNNLQIFEVYITKEGEESFSVISVGVTIGNGMKLRKRKKIIG